MSKPLITIAGETREMNDTEYAQYLLDQEEGAKLQAAEQAKLAARQQAEAKLLALGLTTEDLKALLS